MLSSVDRTEQETRGVNTLFLAPHNSYVLCQNVRRVRRSLRGKFGVNCLYKGSLTLSTVNLDLPDSLVIRSFWDKSIVRPGKYHAKS